MKIIAIILLLIGATACSEDIRHKEAPKNLLTEDEMVEILTELSVLEASYQLKYVQLNKYTKLLKASGDSLIQAHGVNPKDFERNMDYYGMKQAEMIKIYERVRSNLEKSKAELQLVIDKDREE